MAILMFEQKHRPKHICIEILFHARQQMTRLGVRKNKQDTKTDVWKVFSPLENLTGNGFILEKILVNVLYKPKGGRASQTDRQEEVKTGDGKRLYENCGEELHFSRKHSAYADQLREMSEEIEDAGDGHLLRKTFASHS